MSIGPTLRALRHLAEGHRVRRVKLAGGGRMFVLVAGMPQPSVELLTTALWGWIPWQTVWEFNPTKAGGYSEYIHQLKAIFSLPAGMSDGAFEYIRDTLVRCESPQEVKALLAERERFAAIKATAGAHEFSGSGESEAVFYDEPEIARPFVMRPLPDRAQKTFVPNRYRIRTDARGCYLTCAEAPYVMIRAEPGRAVPARRARNYRPGTIFLDGAAQGPPFLDGTKDLYNLDHQSGSIQWLATCEQAMLLIRKGPDLRKRDWLVLVNDDDLDTALAIWVLLNHLRLCKDFALRARIMPLLRLEGVIDAHGLDLQDLAGLPPDLLRSTSAKLTRLRQQLGHAGSEEPLQNLAECLTLLDELIYSPEEFRTVPEIEELAREVISPGSVVVACRSEAGIDPVEDHLKNVYGQRLGILIVESAPGFYQLRQTDPALPAALRRAYDRLNLLDPAVTSEPRSRWGGSSENGSSPQTAETGLTAVQIVNAVREAFCRPNLVDIVAELPGAVVLAAMALAPAGVLLFRRNPAAFERPDGATVLIASVSVMLAAAMLFWFKARAVPGLYGLRAPMGWSWLFTLPPALIGGALGGVWAPGSLGYRMAGVHSEFSATVGLLLAVSAELVFRGVVLGHVALRLPIGSTASRWFGSWPTVIAGCLYAIASVLVFTSLTGSPFAAEPMAVVAAGALIFGLASGIARERSESILPSVLLHGLGTAVVSSSGRLVF